MTFCVADTGKGISSDAQAMLFKKFSRGKGSFRVHTEGLGLYVAKMMLDAHKGRIWVESDGEGKGSKFCFSLSTKLNTKELEKQLPEKKFGTKAPAKKVASQ